VATTTLRDLVAAVGAALVEAQRSAGELPWRPITTPGTDVSSGEADGHFEIRAGPPRPVGIGLEGVTTVESRIAVELNRMLLGDPSEEDANFYDEALLASGAIETSSYPPGCEAVIVDEIGQVERDRDDPTSATVRLMVRATYQAALA
jgi:hypothetical protein